MSKLPPVDVKPDPPLQGIPETIIKKPAPRADPKPVAKKAKKAKKAKPHSGKVEITADEVNGLPLGTAFKGHRPDVHKDVAARLVKEKVAKYV
jgi:hypothetical protein